MTLYESYGHCWVCNAHVRISDLDLPWEHKPQPKKEPENVSETIKIISALPKRVIRGLNLFYDEVGFYILWPNGEYYLRRNWAGGVRYKGPKGLKTPPFKCGIKSNKLILVEGQLNALSLQTVPRLKATVCSPGSASNFQAATKYCLGFKEITICVDNDPAGKANGVHLKEVLLKQGKKTRVVCLDKDFNDMLVDGTLTEFCKREGII